MLFLMTLPLLHFQEAVRHSSLRPHTHMHTTLAKVSAIHYCSTLTLDKSIFYQPINRSIPWDHIK